MTTVSDLYQQVLDREGEQGGIDYWTQRFGDSVDANELAEFQVGARPELVGRIESAYEQNFGRQAETGGQDYWADQVNRGNLGSWDALNSTIRGGAQGYDVLARDDAANYATAWRPGLDPNSGSLVYDAEQDQWNPSLVISKPPKAPTAPNGPGAAYNPSTSYADTGVVNVGVPDTSGAVYAPGTSTTENPTLGASSGWGWNPTTDSWMGTRTGTEYGPTPYKTTDEAGKVIRSWGLAAHPYDRAITTSPVASLPDWDAPNWEGAADESYRRPFADGGSVGDALDRVSDMFGGAPGGEDYTSDTSQAMYDQGGYLGLGIGNPGSYSGDTSPTIYGQGGYLDLGIGNPGSYGGDTVLQANDPTAVAAADAESAESTGLPAWLTGLIGGSSGAEGSGISNNTLLSLLGGAISAYGANQQNKAAADAKAEADKELAAAKAAAAKWGSPLRLVSPRTSVAPTARKGESVWFANNRLPAYAAGGHANIPRNGLGALAQASPNYVRGGTAGQADKVPAALSHGEYIMDADVVSSLGDGNNEAGAAKLDQMRANIRAHKRSAPANSIPPKAKSTQAYMRGAK